MLENKRATFSPAQEIPSKEPGNGRTNGLFNPPEERAPKSPCFNRPSQTRPKKEGVFVDHSGLLDSRIHKNGDFHTSCS